MAVKIIFQKKKIFLQPIERQKVLKSTQVYTLKIFSILTPKKFPLTTGKIYENDALSNAAFYNFPLVCSKGDQLIPVIK